MGAAAVTQNPLLPLAFPARDTHLSVIPKYKNTLLNKIASLGTVSSV